MKLTYKIKKQHKDILCKTCKTNDYWDCGKGMGIIVVHKKGCEYLSNMIKDKRLQE